MTGLGRRVRIVGAGLAFALAAGAAGAAARAASKPAARPGAGAAIREAALDAVERRRADLEDLSVRIWGYAETALRESRSSAALADYAEAQGMTVTRGVAGMPTAFVASYGSGPPVLGVLGEFDALPGLSQKAQTSKEPLEAGAPGHGCGHNLFGPASLGAALAIKDLIAAGKLRGTVRYFGTPAEEAVGGKIYMLREKVLSGLDACFVWHPGDRTLADAFGGQALLDLVVEFSGKASHAAHDPWNGRSAVDGVEAFTHGVNLLREHIRPTVRMHYTIAKGGDVPNVVPEYGRVWIWLRDFRRDGVEEVLERVRGIAEGAALIAGVTSKATIQSGDWEMLINQPGIRLLQSNLEALGPIAYTPEEDAFARELQRTAGVEPNGMKTGVVPIEEQSPEGGSSDVGDVSWTVPTLHMTVAVAPEDVPWHSWYVVASAGSSIGRKGMMHAARAMALSIADVMADARLLRAIRADFEERTRGVVYTPYIHDGPPPVPADARDAPDPGAAQGGATMNRIAEEYVKLVLAVGAHEPAYVDAFYGPAGWRAEAEAAKKPLEAIRAESAALRRALEGLAVAPGADPLERLRRDYLATQLASVSAHVEQLLGGRMTFDEEAKALYDAVPPRIGEESLLRVLDRLEAVVPGSGPLPERLESFRKRFVIPPGRLDAVFRAAIEECRARTRSRIPLPEGESFTVEYVTDRSWSAYNWYQGGLRSRIQVNTSLPIYVDRAIDLACHEGYPGHHVYNLLLEQRLVRERGWVEYTVYPLYSPQSLIAEGTANYGIRIAFPGGERAAFERARLFPIAGLDPDEASRYYDILELMHGLDYARNEAARRLLDGEIEPAGAAAWMRRFGLLSPERAEQSVRFIREYRAYVINYNLGQDLVKAYVEREAGEDPAARWRLFADLISSPRLPGGLL